MRSTVLNCPVPVIVDALHLGGAAMAGRHREAAVGAEELHEGYRRASRRPALRDGSWMYARRIGSLHACLGA